MSNVLKIGNRILKIGTKILCPSDITIVRGEYTSDYDYTNVFGTPFQSEVAVPINNTVAVDASPYCELVSTYTYRGNKTPKLLTNCLKVDLPSDISIDFRCTIGNESAITYTAYLGICHADDLSDWKNTSTILDSVTRSHGSGYTYYNWIGSCSASNESGILFFATESGVTTNYPRLWGRNIYTINISTMV